MFKVISGKSTKDPKIQKMVCLNCDKKIGRRKCYAYYHMSVLSYAYHKECLDKYAEKRDRKIPECKIKVVLYIDKRACKCEDCYLDGLSGEKSRALGTFNFSTIKKSYRFFKILESHYGKVK